MQCPIWLQKDDESAEGHRCWKYDKWERTIKSIGGQNLKQKDHKSPLALASDGFHQGLSQNQKYMALTH